jgi:hypothetical protein
MLTNPQFEHIFVVLLELAHKKLKYFNFVLKWIETNLKTKIYNLDIWMVNINPMKTEKLWSVQGIWLEYMWTYFQNVVIFEELFKNYTNKTYLKIIANYEFNQYSKNQ